ncbi:hypothetical protein BC629DRAFT_1486731 [Irpex lacteus]|nr:hypothetical protein BC629DRAFT_1486731 [Irpex lacteus]
MSIQSETVASGASNGPGLSVANGLPLPGSAVNQSAGTAQVQHHPAHHPQDPYASYSQYPGVVTYGAPYAHNVLPSSLSHDPHHAAHHEPPPPTGHSEPNTQQPQQSHHGSQHHLSEVNHQEQILAPEHRSPVEPVPPSPSLVLERLMATGSVEEHTPAPKKRRQRAIVDGDVKEDSDLGPSGGAKHWTDEEKTRLFHWMLTDDNRWESFGSKMNTIFREHVLTAAPSRVCCSLQFRKTFTALKSVIIVTSTCSNKSTRSKRSLQSTTMRKQQEMQECGRVAPSFVATPAQRQTFLERKLDAARNFGVPVGNLTIRVLDHWQAAGWYILFKRRFRKTHRPGCRCSTWISTSLDEGTSADGRMDEDEDGGPSALHMSRTNESLTEAQRRHLDPNDSSRGAGSVHRARTSCSFLSPPPVPQGDYQVYQLVQQQIHLQTQTAQALTHLTNMTQTLLGTCTTLTELVRAQMEDGKTQTDLMRKREERDATGSSGAANEGQRAALASDMLSNPRTPEDIKKLAADYLKRLFQ